MGKGEINDIIGVKLEDDWLLLAVGGLIDFRGRGCDVGGDRGDVVLFGPSVFMDWMRFMRRAQNGGDGQRIPRDRHVANRHVSTQRAMSESVAVESK